MPTHEARGLGQVLDGIRRGAEEVVVEELLMAPRHSSELAGQGDREQKVENGKQ